jgi:nucleoside-diphosphate-sugar epimerase
VQRRPIVNVALMRSTENVQALVEQGDEPLPVREWLPAFAKWLNAPPPPQISVDDALKTEGGADAVYYCTQLRGVSNAKAKRELNFQPRPLEWIVDTALPHAG